MGNINTMLSLDGESEFRRQLSLINANLKTLEKELTATSTQFTVGSAKMKQQTDISANYAKQMEFLSAKQDVLKKAVASTDKSFNDHKAKLDEAVKAYSTASANVDNMKQRIEKATAAYGADSEQVEKLQAELKQLESVQTAAAKAVNAAEKQLDKVGAANQRYRQQLADCNTQINRTEQAERTHNQSLEQSDKDVQKLNIDLDRLKSALDKVGTGFKTVGTACAKIAQGELKAVEVSFQAVSKEIELGTTGLETYVKAVTAAGVAVGGFALKNGATFEQSMSKVKAYSGASEEDLSQLSDAAKEMGATTSKTASEAADALGYLALNGYKTSQMLSTLKPIVKAAEAGNMSLATVADMTANSLTAYGKSAEDAENFLNVLAATQNNSSTSIEQLLQTYKDLSGTFKLLNVDFNESATLLGLVANRGLKGVEAGTALNSVMLRLLGTNKNAETALTSIGVSAWDNEGKFKGLTKTLREVNAAMADMTDQEKANFEKDVSGVMRFQEFNKLLDAAADTENYDKLYATVSSAQDNNYLYSTAETMLDNLKGRLTLLKSASEALGITIFETFGGRTSAAVEKLTKWVDILNDRIGYGKLSGILEGIHNVANGISHEMTAGIEQAAKELPSKLKIFNKVVSEGARLLIQGIKESKSTILPELITGARDLALDLAGQLPEFVSEIADGAVIMFGGITQAMSQIADKLLTDLPAMVEKLLTSITDNAPRIFQTGFDVLQKLADGIADNVPAILRCADQIIDNLTTGISNNLDNIVDTGLNIINALIEDIAVNFPKILNTAGEIVSKLVSGMQEKQTLEKLTDAAVDIIVSFCEYLGENFDKIIDKAYEMVETICDELTTPENMEKLDKAGQALGKALWDGFKAILKNSAKYNFFTSEGLGREMDDIADYMESQGNPMADVYRQTGESLKSQPSASASAESTLADELTSKFGRTRQKNINFNAPVTVNNMGDLDTVIETASAAMDQAELAGGRY